MSLPLAKIAETDTTITLGWNPPAGVEWYLFYAAGTRVSNAPPVDKNGVVKQTIRYSKGREPYEVVAVVRSNVGVFWVESGKYQPLVAIYPSLSRYPSETV